MLNGGVSAGQYYNISSGRQHRRGVISVSYLVIFGGVSIAAAYLSAAAASAYLIFGSSAICINNSASYARHQSRIVSRLVSRRDKHHRKRRRRHRLSRTLLRARIITHSPPLRERRLFMVRHRAARARMRCTVAQHNAPLCGHRGIIGSIKRGA